MSTFRSRSIIFAAALSLLSTGSALATPPVASPDDPKQVACGGDLGAFLEGVKADALAKGIPADAIQKALAGAQIDPKVLSRDRAQGVFRQTFLNSPSAPSARPVSISAAGSCRSSPPPSPAPKVNTAYRPASSPRSGPWKPTSEPFRVISTPAMHW